MKWKAKPSPKKGDTRIVKSFALYPIRTTDGYWLWLEFYVKEQVYSCGSSPGGYFSGWITNYRFKDCLIKNKNTQ